ncbi:MAG TPA: TIGR03118 family protein [Kofleriaceae bacterium]
MAFLRGAPLSALASLLLVGACSGDDDTGSDFGPGTGSGGDNGGSGSGNGSGSGAGLCNSFVVTNLTADRSGAGGASNVNPFLVNPWGIAAYQGMFWVADEATGRVSILDGSGKAATGKTASDRLDLGPGITGVTVNDSTAMQIEGQNACGPANLIFGNLNGQLIGVNTDLDATGGFVLADRSSAGASYTGVTTIHVRASSSGNGGGRGSGSVQGLGAGQGSGSGSGRGCGQGSGQGGQNAGPVLALAADFHNARIDVFNENFRLVPAPMFTTPVGVPAGFAPFNIWAWNNVVYVTYAQQRSGGTGSSSAGLGSGGAGSGSGSGAGSGSGGGGTVAGAGLGYVAAFDTTGKLLWLAKGSELNAPWGLAVGDQTSLCDQTQTSAFAGVLLVGNYGDGRVTALDSHTGAVLGQLMDPNHTPISIDGLWGLTFGTNIQGAVAGGLYFTAGTGNEQHGMFGVITWSPTSTRTTDPRLLTSASP